VLAAWSGGGPGVCPTTELACNDDSCGLESRIQFPVTIGTSYYIEVGGYFGAQYTGAISIGVAVPATNDDCATPTVVVGSGPHPFNTIGATTGTQGQNEAACLSFGSTAHYNDVWFQWVAPSSGSYAATLCGTTAFDSVVAVFSGAGCPTAPTIGCDDDGCGVMGAESVACFSAVAGQTYTIQIGGWGVADAGSGTFSLVSSGGTIGCTPADDGSTETSIGAPPGGAMGWLVRFGDVGQTSSVSAVRTAFGSPGATYTPMGLVTVAVWEDPNDDGNPNDAILLASASAPVNAALVGTNQFQTVALSAPIGTTGVYFAGATVTHPAGQTPAPLDQSGGGGPCGGGRSWAVADGSGMLNLANLAANAFPPIPTAGAGFPGDWLLRVECGPPGTPYCAGDGSGPACPCGNSSTQAGTGCQHSYSGTNYGGAGARLAATGVASLAADTLQLQATQLPPSPPSLFFQGTAAVATPLGDGLRCAGGTVVRLYQRPAVGGAVQSGFGVAGDAPIHVAGLIGSAPASRYYQLWFRNQPAFCTPQTWNLTNGLQVNWIP
jgi:hypothetical protein